MEIKVNIEIDDIVDQLDDQYILDIVEERGLYNPADFSREEIQYLIDKLEDEPIATVGDDIRARLVLWKMEVKS